MSTIPAPMSMKNLKHLPLLRLLKKFPDGKFSVVGRATFSSPSVPEKAMVDNLQEKPEVDSSMDDLKEKLENKIHKTAEELYKADQELGIVIEEYGKFRIMRPHLEAAYAYKTDDSSEE